MYFCFKEFSFPILPLIVDIFCFNSGCVANLANARVSIVLFGCNKKNRLVTSLNTEKLFYSQGENGKH